MTGGTIPPSSKTKKEATNKTKKEEVSRRKVSQEKNKKEAAAKASSTMAASSEAPTSTQVPEESEDIPEEQGAGPRKMSAVLTGKYLFLHFYPYYITLYIYIPTYNEIV